MTNLPFRMIEDPTSGLVIGRHQAIEWVKQQSNGMVDQ